MGKHAGIEPRFAVKTDGAAGHSTRQLADGEEGIDSVERTAGNWHTNNGIICLHGDDTGKSSGQTSNGDDDDLFTAGIELLQVVTKFSVVAMSGKDLFFKCDLFCIEIIATGLHEGLVAGASVNDDDFHREKVCRVVGRVLFEMQFGDVRAALTTVKDDLFCSSISSRAGLFTRGALGHNSQHAATIGLKSAVC